MELGSFFNPKSIAVIGASEDPNKVGHAILLNFVNNFKGEVFAINPNAEKVLGLKCYKSILDVQRHVELAIVAVPPKIANHAVYECIQKKAEAIIIITAGYREIGPIGIHREAELKSIIHNKKTRVMGPNCIGILDLHSNINTLFSPEYKLERNIAGDISIISQSGAFGTAMLDYAAEKNIGISKFISYGNAVDVDEVDLINYLVNDKKTKTILLYVEGVRNGRLFYETLKKARKKKPIIVLKAGRSEEGAKAAISHTGSLAGSYNIFNAALKQAGVIEALNIEELFDFAKIFTYLEPRKGENVAIITNGGGFGVLSADACIQENLKLAEFEKSTIKNLEKILPDYATIHNPLDVVGDATVERFDNAIRIAMDDKNVHAIVLALWLLSATLDEIIINIIVEYHKQSKKPVIVSAVGGKYTNLLINTLEKERVPVFPTSPRAMRALKKLFEFGNHP